MSLFDESERRRLAEHAPLAVRMRPRTPAEFVGQEHFFGPGKLLRRMLESAHPDAALEIQKLPPKRRANGQRRFLGDASLPSRGHTDILLLHQPVRRGDV